MLSKNIGRKRIYIEEHIVEITLLMMFGKAISEKIKGLVVINIIAWNIFGQSVVYPLT